MPGPRVSEKFTAQRAAKGTRRARLAVVITRRVSLDRLQGGEALRDARGGIRVGRNEKSCSSPATRSNGRPFLPLFVITARQEARARVA